MLVIIRVRGEKVQVSSTPLKLNSIGQIAMLTAIHSAAGSCVGALQKSAYIRVRSLRASMLSLLIGLT